MRSTTTLPASWEMATFEANATVDPDGEINECNEDNTGSGEWAAGSRTFDRELDAPRQLAGSAVRSAGDDRRQRRGHRVIQRRDDRTGGLPPAAMN